MLFIMSLNFIERGIREIKDDPKRAQAARDLAKKCGCEIKQIYLTSGEYDVIRSSRPQTAITLPNTRWPTAAWALYAAAPPAPGRWKRSQRSSRNYRKAPLGCLLQGIPPKSSRSISVSYLGVLLPKLKARRASSTRQVSIFSL